jgi:rsbT co-antagonist protein RsbR
MASDTPTVEALQAENTQLRQRIAELEQDTSLFRAIFEHSSEALFIIEEGRFTVCNQATLDLFGCSSSDQLLGHHPAELSPEYQPDGRLSTEKAEELIATAFRQGSVRFDWYHRTVDGRIFPAEIFLTIISLNGRTLVYGNWRDITERKNIEQAWHATRRQMQAVISSAPLILFSIDAEGVFTLSEGKGLELVGLQPGQVVGQSVFELYKELPELLEAVRGAFAGKTQICPTNVGDIFFDNYLTPLYDEQGQQQGVIGIAIDVSERQRAQVVLKRSEERLRTIIEAIPTGICITNRDYSYEYVNPAYCKLYNYTPEELIGQTFTKVVPEEQRPALTALHDQFMGQRAEVRGEWQVVDRAGQLLSILADAAHIIDVDGLPKKVTFVTDITARKQAEEDLLKFKTLVENAPDAIFAADLKGHITYANPSCRTMYGYGDEIIGLPIVNFAQGNQARIDQLMDTLWQEGAWQGSVTHQRKDGSTFPVQVSTFLIHDARNDPIAIVSMHHDMTERVQQEQERVELQQQIIEAQRNTVRELSTPLIPIAEDVVIMPLIGTVDSQRAQQVMEALLEGIARYQAEIVILDITGVQVVDTQVANAFIHAAHAVKLLGARIMLTGIQPQIAQTLVHLGVDLSSIETQSSLQAGIAAVLGHQRH